MTDTVVPAGTWTTGDIVDEALRALHEGGTADARLVDGRVVDVKASPSTGGASHVALGVAALPPRYRTTAHSHFAEEVAIVLRGAGTIWIKGTKYPVRPGSIVLTPSDAEHVTESKDEELVILWMYAPPGSEVRWLADRNRDTGDDEE